LGNTSLLKLLKLLRLSRMARMARLLRQMQELLILIKGMLAAVRSVSVTLVLLGLLIYVFAVYFRQMATQYEALADSYFSSMAASMHSLMIHGVMLDALTDIVADMEAEPDAYHLLFAFYFFMLLGSLTVMNMLIGVLYDVVCAVATVEQEELAITYAKEQLLNIIQKLEEDKLREELKQKGMTLEESGLTVDKTELIQNYAVTKLTFKEIFLQPATAPLLQEIDVNPTDLVDIVDALFIDADGTEKTLSFGDLVECMLDQRSSNSATVKDLTKVRRFIRKRSAMIQDKGDDLADEIEEVAVRRNAQLTVLGRMLSAKGGGDFEEKRQAKYNQLKALEQNKKAEIERLRKEQEAKARELLERTLEERAQGYRLAKSIKKTRRQTGMAPLMDTE